MSRNFYESTRVTLDGRLVSMFLNTNEKGAHARLPFWKDEKVIGPICEHAKKGLTNAQSSELVGISPSEVSKIRRIYRERWHGFRGVKSGG
jgi:hypothetical protein